MTKHLNNKNIFKLEINDLFIELKEENNRLLNELQFALKFIHLLENQRNYFINRLNCCLNCGSDPQINEQINSFNEEKNYLLINKLDENPIEFESDLNQNHLIIEPKVKKNNQKINKKLNFIKI